MFSKDFLGKGSLCTVRYLMLIFLFAYVRLFIIENTVRYRMYHLSFISQNCNNLRNLHTTTSKKFIFLKLAKITTKMVTDSISKKKSPLASKDGKFVLQTFAFVSLSSKLSNPSFQVHLFVKLFNFRCQT